MPDLLITITSFDANGLSWPASHGSNAPVVAGDLTVEGTLSCSTSANPAGKVWLRIDGANTPMQNLSATTWSKTFNIPAGDRNKRIGVFARADAGNESAGHALTVTLFVLTTAVGKKRRKKKPKKGSKKRDQENE